jgi:hypothetical protein
LEFVFTISLSSTLGYYGMYVKVKRGRLKDLSLRDQTFLVEGRRYFAEDIGTGVVIGVEQDDAVLQFFLPNETVERHGETKPHKPVKEYVYDSANYLYTLHCLY